MAESSADIIKYLEIIENKGPMTGSVDETDIDLGATTEGVDIGKMYTFDGGLCWAKVVSEEDDCWIIEHGLLEHQAGGTEYMSKYDMAEMVRNGSMVYIEEELDILEESFELEESGLDEFIDRVNRFLLVNEGKEVEDFDYNWNDAYSKGLSPVEAADEALILED